MFTEQNLDSALFFWFHSKFLYPFDLFTFFIILLRCIWDHRYGSSNHRKPEYLYLIGNFKKLTLVNIMSIKMIQNFLKVISHWATKAFQICIFFDPETPMEMLLHGEREHAYLQKRKWICVEFLWSAHDNARLKSHLEYKLVRILSGPMTKPPKTNVNKKRVFGNGGG